MTAVSNPIIRIPVLLFSMHPANEGEISTMAVVVVGLIVSLQYSVCLQVKCISSLEYQNTGMYCLTYNAVLLLKKVTLLLTLGRVCSLVESPP